jgi:hypothetical protein
MKPAKIFYLVGSSSMIFMGAAHFYGQFGAKEFSVQRSLIEEAMRQYNLSGLGFEYSLFDVMQCWGVFFGILMILFGSQNILILRNIQDNAALKKITIINTIGAITLSLAGAAYVPFTTVGLVVISFCFAKRRLEIPRIISINSDQ